MKELIWSANIEILYSNTRKTKSEYDSHKTDSKDSELACDCNNEILCHLI